MTNKQKVKNIFPSAYSFKRDKTIDTLGLYEVWIDGIDTCIDVYFQGNKSNIYWLAEGRTWQEAWERAWKEIQKQMLRKLESN